MSMRLAMDDRRDGIEEGERVFAGQRLRSPAASAGEVSGPVATITLSHSAGGRPSISSRAMSICGCASSARVIACGEAVAVDGQRAAGGQLMRDRPRA